MKVVWSVEALHRLEKIEEYIADNNPTVAIEFVDKIIQKRESLIKNPLRGRIVPEFGSPFIREIIFKNYRIIYHYSKSSIEILTVFEAHRMLKEGEIFFSSAHNETT